MAVSNELKHNAHPSIRKIIAILAGSALQHLPPTMCNGLLEFHHQEYGIFNESVSSHIIFTH